MEKLKNYFNIGFPYVGPVVLLVVCILNIVSNENALMTILLKTILTGITIGIFVAYLQLYSKGALLKKRQILLFWGCFIVGYIPSTILLSNNEYMMPIILVSLLITIMFNVRLGVLSNFVILLVMMFSTNISYEATVLYMLSGFFISLTMSRAKTRKKVAYITLLNIIMMVVISLLTYLFTHGNFESYDPMTIIIVALNALICYVLALGTMTLWEALFDVTTNTKLVEIAEPGYPLLAKLLEEAPGTYHHSQLVANLAEKAATEIEANQKLAKAGALFHDIGKMEHPEYFIENQADKNIHDEIDPESSAKYIIDHVQNGVAIAKKHKLPKEVVSIIREHQGDAILSYFYKKAVDHSDGFEIDEIKFTYERPKPQTKEAGVVMLADCVEAAIKALPEKDRTMEKIEEMIDSVFNTVYNNKQLDDSPLLLKELPIVKGAFIKVYNGMYHQRNI